MKVLVIVDEQKDFTNGVLGNAECNATVGKIVDIINTQEFDKVILTRDTHGDNYLNTQEGNKLPVTHCIEGSDGWQIRDEIMQAVKHKYSINVSDKGYYLLNKHSFGSMYLGKWLEENYFLGQEEIEIYFTGVCTGICVISNVMITKAALPEAKISVIADACACVTPESHKIAIEAMKTCQVDII